MGVDILYFSWVDYMFFIGLLCVSVLIGIYYGCFGNKQNTTEEYLHGGKKMKSFPIGMSLTASHISGITLLGVPTEIYLYGTQYLACVITIVLLTLAIIYVYLPVYYKLQLPSSYEYLSIRFGHSVRNLASMLFVLSAILHVPLVIYVPSLALNQVTGISIYTISPVICVVCIFYTTLGGLKAVVFSDTVQIIITILTMLAVFTIGLYSSGGLKTVWENAQSRDRIQFFDMSFDPTVRETFWGVVIGMGITFIGNLGITPSSVQRFLSIPTYAAAKRAAIIFGVGTILAKIISSLTGLLMFSRYMDCDPFTSGKIKRVDQLLPYYLLDAIGNLKGLPGLFVAGVFGTALSNMSTNINTLSLTIYEDFIKSRLPYTTTQRTTNIIIKSIVVISGLLCLIFIFLIEKLGGVLQISISFHALTHGPLVGITTLGMLFPSANKQGALWGGIASTILTGILVGGVQVYTMLGRIPVVYKPLSTAQCSYNISSTVMPEEVPEKPPAIFLISFYYFTLIGALLVIIIGLAVSWITRKNDDPPVCRDLLSPCIYWFLSKDVDKDQELAKYESVENALAKLKGGTVDGNEIEKMVGGCSKSVS